MNNTEKEIRKALSIEATKQQLGNTLANLIQTKLKKGLARESSNNSDSPSVCSIPSNGGIPQFIVHPADRFFEIASAQETDCQNLTTPNKFRTIGRLITKAVREMRQQENTNVISLIDHVAVHAVLSWSEIFEQLSPNEILISNQKSTSKNMIKAKLPKRIAYKIPKGIVSLHQTQPVSYFSADRMYTSGHGDFHAMIGYVFSETIQMGLSQTEGIYKYFVI